MTCSFPFKVFCFIIYSISLCIFFVVYYAYILYTYVLFYCLIMPAKQKNAVDTLYNSAGLLTLKTGEKVKNNITWEMSCLVQHSIDMEGTGNNK